MELRPSAWQATPEHNQVLLKLKKRKKNGKGEHPGPREAVTEGESRHEMGRQARMGAVKVWSSSD